MNKRKISSCKIVNNIILNVKIIRSNNDEELRNLINILEKIIKRYQFNLDRNFAPFSSARQDEQLSKGPALLFVDISDMRREDVRYLLNKLSERRFTWVFLLCKQFNSEIAAEVWMDYPCVVGYELKTRLNSNDIEKLIRDLVEPRLIPFKLAVFFP